MLLSTEVPASATPAPTLSPAAALAPTPAPAPALAPAPAPDPAAAAADTEMPEAASSSAAAMVAVERAVVGDCGRCAMCLDKVRFGGPGLKHKACLAKPAVPAADRRTSATPHATNSVREARGELVVPAPLTLVPTGEAEEVVATLERMQNDRESQRDECHGWVISYAVRSKQYAKESKKRGDFVVTDPRDGERLFSILGVKRKLGLVAAVEGLGSAPGEGARPRSEADEAHERELLDRMQEDRTECFATTDGGPWFHARLISTRSRQPRFCVEFTKALEGSGSGTGQRAPLPQPRMRHVPGSHILLERPPLPPSPPLPRPTAQAKTKTPQAPPAGAKTSQAPPAGAKTARAGEHPSTWSATP